MRSSISSSNDRLPRLAWRKIFALAAFALVFSIVVWDAFWIRRGFSLEPKDDVELWSYHRRRVGKAGDKALVFLGSSRIKAGMDLDEARRPGYAPFQLAMAGRSPVAILENLAADEHFRGTAIVEITEYVLHRERPDQGNYGAEGWVAEYEKTKDDFDWFYPVKSGAQRLVVAPGIGDTLPEVFASVVTGKIFDENYLEEIAMRRPPITKFNRSSQGYADDLSPEQIENRRQFSIRAVQETMAARPPDPRRFAELVRRIEAATQKIQRRGGLVALVNFPLNGEVKELNERYFPRRDYWEKLAAASSALKIHYADYSQLAAIETLDGTHFSGRGATLFTDELLKIIARRNN